MEEDYGGAEWEDISDEEYTPEYTSSESESETDMEDAEIDFDGNKPTGSMEHNRGNLVSGPTPEDFTCGVCIDLLLEPTTLQCGHSFCRHCLARWFLSSNKMECPQCRQQYTSLPRVSVTLRSAIENQMSSRYEQRKRMFQTPEAQNKISTFERKVRTYNVSTLQHQLMQGAQALNPAQGRNRVNWRDRDVWIGLAVITLAVLAVWTIFKWLFGSSLESTVSKPMARWTEHETMLWLAQIGSWADNALIESFTNMHIDGSILLALKEEDLTGISSDLHRRAFIVARDAALHLGSKPPADFWEYKHMHLFKVSWAVVAFQKYPRMAIFFLWLFDYGASFLPLVHSTCPVQDLQYVNLYTQKLDDLTFGQWLDFLFRWLLSPHLGIFGDFTLKHIWHTNFFTSLWILFSLLMLGIIDILVAIIFVMERSGARQASVKHWCDALILSSFFYVCAYVLWNFIPTFLINIWFYFNLIFHTIAAFPLVRNNIRAINALNISSNEQRRRDAAGIEQLYRQMRGEPLLHTD